MNNRRLRLICSDYQREHKRKFLKSSVIGFGFLSGLWAHFGFDPSSFVASWLEVFLLSLNTVYEQWILLTFLYAPALLTFFAIVLVYRRGGMFGFVAVAFAYAAGLLFSLLSIPLMILAIVIGWFAARRV
jgi:hypothetical protein